MPSSTQDFSKESATLSVAKAKANLSSVLKGVEKHGTAVTISRRGVPVAQIIPFPPTQRVPLLGSMAGTGRELGDIVSPYMEEWTVDGQDWAVARE